MKKFLLSVAFVFVGVIANAQCTSTILNQNNSCGIACNGFIALEFQGNMPFWLTIAGPPGMTIGPIQVTTVFSIGNLCPGVYDYILVDNTGDTCVTNNFVINPTTPIDLTIISTNATCSGCSDGTATISGVTGGSPPFTYQWSTGQVGSSITGLAPGGYTCYVTDINGCFDLDTFYIGVGSSGYYTVSGQVYFDTNGNGVQDIGEVGLANQQVQMQPGAVNAITNNQGNYGVVVAPGTYDLTYQATPGWNLTSSPSTHTATVTTASIGALDFGIFPDSTHGSVAVTITSGFPRCFWDVPYYLNITNTGFTILNGTAEFTHDQLMTFVNSSVTPLSQAGNQLTYTISNLLPGQSQIIVVTLTEPQGGSVVSNSLSINASDNFGNQLAESTNFTQSISCAYDPNDKQVQPVGVGLLNYVAMDEWLTYQVRFQNTGNDTAFRVVIIDTISAALDLNTFTLLGSSHNVDVTMRAGNEVSFIFDNILLPDSNVNEPGSHGYVLYRIKGNASNPDPSTVENTAHIIFDLNSAIVTNTTLTTLSDNFLGLIETGGENVNFNIYPNPMSNGATLRYTGPDSGNFDVEILDITGKSVMIYKQMKNGNLFIPKNGLNAGTYILKVNTSTPTYLRLVVR